MIGVPKKQMQRSLGTRRYSHEEICLLLQKTAQIGNSSPLARGTTLDLKLLTPADLLMGRAMAGIPSFQFKKGRQLTRRLQAIKEG
jgi:hypothetical protein